MKLPLSFLLSMLPFAACTKVVDFNSANAKGANNLKDLVLQSRIIVPYGPDIYSENPTQTAEDRPYKGYGYGMVSLTTEGCRMYRRSKIISKLICLSLFGHF